MRSNLFTFVQGDGRLQPTGNTVSADKGRPSWQTFPAELPGRCKSLFAPPGHSQVAPGRALVCSCLGLLCGRRLQLTIDLKEGGRCVHSVENRKRHGQVDHDYPGFKAKDNFLQSVVVLGATAEGRRDPELQEKGHGACHCLGGPTPPQCPPGCGEAASQLPQ